MFIQSIQFKREKDSEWEDGLYIAECENGANDIIIDSKYKVVEGMIWDRKEGKFDKYYIQFNFER